MSNKTTQHIGSLSGKILVFGGVYSNYQALEAIIEVAEQHSIPNTNIICTGDIVAYCAEPEKCVKTIAQWGIHSILGNVEIQLRDNEEDCGCNFDNGTRCDIFSRQWYPFAKSEMSLSSIEFFKILPDFIHFEYAGKQCFVLHGSYFNTSEFIFSSTDWSIKQRNFEATKSDIILSGHCGLPFHSIQNNQYWLNAGVIGMPANDGNPSVWYMILDDKNGFSFEHHTLEYDYEKAQRLMQQHQLPSSYAQTLTSGIWDNCDILPEEETQMQGKAISF